MLKGILLNSNPTKKQKVLLSQWMGCARFIWNAKYEEEEYLSSFSRKYLPIKTYPKADQSFSQYKDRDLSPWLFDCPSQILRNSASNWYKTHQSFLDKGWHQLEIFLEYKASDSGKALFKVPAHYTSQECADCGHTHPNNRKRQNLFSCESCGHSVNADENAAEVIKKRAINLILNSGTELSKRGVLLDIGRGAVTKSSEAEATDAHSKETSKKKRQAITA